LLLAEEFPDRAAAAAEANWIADAIATGRLGLK
jgi:hypothetical protein